MICEVCRLVDRDNKETVTVSMKDRNGRIWYTCKEHAQLMHNHNMVCWNCGSKKNCIHKEKYMSYPGIKNIKLVSYDIFCKRCCVDVGYYKGNEYVRFKNIDEVLAYISED